jgi:MFS transporter, PAT family, beta-lactamase induction signal transducer AmpG
MKAAISIPLKQRSTIPALSENIFLRYLNFIALYFAQGIPIGMLFFGIPAWMAMNGKTASEIATFAVVVALPPSFKFVVAPLMDRYTYLPMGRKRPWVILGQIGLVVSCIFMAHVPDPLSNLNQLMLAGFVVTFFSSFQDVATDGMAVDIIPQNQQARANGLMWGSMIIAISTSLALGTWLLNKYDFTIAMLMPAVVIGIIILVPIFLRERQGEKILPWTSGTASTETKQLQLNSFADIFKSLYSVFSLRNSLLLALLIFIGLGSFKYIGTLLPIFTVKELSWTNVEYSQYYATAKLIGGIVGMLLGGVLIEKFGKKTMINIYFFGLVFFITVLSFSKNYWSDKTFIYAFMIAHNILYTFASIGVFAVAMQCCWKKISASQFALYMTIANLGQISLAALIGPIKENFSWQITLFAYAIMVGFAWLLLQFLNINKQMEKVAELENWDVENKQ